MCGQSGAEEITEINPAYGQLQGMLPKIMSNVVTNCVSVAQMQHERIESSVNPAYSTIMLHHHNVYETVL